jgi:beta-phosphoglucomutase-like phosphatase (HAD superfamily)
MVEEVEMQEDVQEESNTASNGILFLELDNIGYDVRNQMFEQLQKVLKSDGVKLSRVDFCKHALYDTPQKAADSLVNAIDGISMSADDLAAALQKGLDEYYAGQSQASDIIKAFVESASSRDVMPVVFSMLSGDAMSHLLDQCGVPQDAVEMLSLSDSGDKALRAPVWMRMIRQYEAPVRRCMVVASSSTACKSALSAGMRCIGIPDSFTAFQDFSGAQRIFDSVDEVNAEDLMAEFFADDV